MIDIDDNALLNIELRNRGNQDVTELVRAVIIMRRQLEDLGVEPGLLPGQAVDDDIFA